MSPKLREKYYQASKKLGKVWLGKDTKSKTNHQENSPR